VQREIDDEVDGVVGEKRGDVVVRTSAERLSERFGAAQDEIGGGDEVEVGVRREAVYVRLRDVPTSNDGNVQRAEGFQKRKTSGGPRGREDVLPKEQEKNGE